MSHFDTYGRMASVENINHTIQNGRYTAQAEAEKLIPEDVIKKLQIESDDVFLDVGCGLGLNLNVISKMVQKSAACDHENIITRLRKQKEFSDVEFFSGSFLDINFPHKYKKILAYSVIPALPDEDCVFAFVKKACDVLSSDGICLLGDLANSDKKNRFINSLRGKAFQREWEALRRDETDQVDISQYQQKEDTKSVHIDDDLILRILGFIRQKGFDAYVLNQPHDLPFGNTREDILILGPECELRKA